MCLPVNISDLFVKQHGNETNDHKVKTSCNMSTDISVKYAACV